MLRRTTLFQTRILFSVALLNGPAATARRGEGIRNVKMSNWKAEIREMRAFPWSRSNVPPFLSKWG